jgi:ATP-dependent 26S proteasome regulatory subunit
VKKAFTKASAKEPSVLIVEEVDYIAKNKDLFYVFLAQLDLFECSRSLVLATTNKLTDIDKALRRGGRLDIDLRMDMPSASDRYHVLHQHLSSVPHSFTETDLKLMAAAASGFVCSDLAQIVRNARLSMVKNKVD